MHPFADARVAAMVPSISHHTKKPLPVSCAASNSGVIAVPRYCQGSSATLTYHVIVAAMISVRMPARLPKGMERLGERHSSAAWAVPSMPR